MTRSLPLIAARLRGARTVLCMRSARAVLRMIGSAGVCSAPAVTCSGLMPRLIAGAVVLGGGVRLLGIGRLIGGAVVLGGSVRLLGMSGLLGKVRVGLVVCVRGILYA